MKTAWWIVTAVVLVGSPSASAFLLHRKKSSAAQAMAIVFVGYVLVLTALWGMASSFVRYHYVDVPQPAKRILLALTGGILAQFLIILDRALRGTLSKNRVAPIYFRGLIGALAGVVGLLIVSLRFSSLEQVDDSLAVLSGVAGGGLGASVVEVARNKVFGASKK